MIETIILVVFVLGYLAIAFEHTLKLDKLIPALIMMAVMWGLISYFDLTVFEIDTKNKELIPEKLKYVLNYFLGHTAEILVFLIGAMTIVETIDFFNGFATIKRLIKTKSKVKILWIICSLAFVLSAIIDNLTATIVLITILQKLVTDKNLKLWYAGMIIVAANAGGAWSPIGDITTTMLWIGNKVSIGALIKFLIIPSLVCMILPTFIASKYKVFQGEIQPPKTNDIENPFGSKILIIGLSSIVFVLGFLSAAIDNVPLVAASMGMFGEAIDNPLWHGIAYAAGTGGSMVIIGSAAGVVAMGMEKIDFMWYLKKIAFLAFVGYLAGFLVFILLRDYVLM